MTPLSLTDRAPFSVEGSDAARLIVRSVSQSVSAQRLSNSITTTGLLSEQASRISALTLPLAILASAYVPANVTDIVCKYRPAAATLARLAPSATASADVEWHYAPEQITRAEIEELQRIWALPYPGDTGFDIGRID